MSNFTKLEFTYRQEIFMNGFGIRKITYIFLSLCSHGIIRFIVSKL